MRGRKLRLALWEEGGLPPPSAINGIMCDLKLDYSLMLQLWQAVFSTSPLHWLDLITGDGLEVDAELVSHLNRKKAEEALCQA